MCSQVEGFDEGRPLFFDTLQWMKDRGCTLKDDQAILAARSSGKVKVLDGVAADESVPLERADVQACFGFGEEYAHRCCGVHRC